MTVLSKFQGCFIGLALGDALCAPYEGGILEGLLWRLIGRTSDGRMRFTDDTQMSLDLARSLTEKGALDQDHIAQSFAHSYRWSRGYGPSAAKLLKRIKAGASWQVENTRQHPQGSYGNGAAMRAPVIALAYNNQPEEMESAVYRASLITHAHPLGIEGARLIAQVVSESIRGRSALEAGKAGLACCDSEAYRTRMNKLLDWLESDNFVDPKRVRKELGNGIAALRSCPTAVYIGLRFLNFDFDELLRFVRAVKGDTDTIAAMAGAIWGAYNGIDRFDPKLIEKLEKSDEILQAASDLHRMF